MRYDHLVAIPPGIPPGDYQLWMRLVRTEDGSTVPLGNNQSALILSDVTVEASRCDIEPTNLPTDFQNIVRFGNDLGLYGYDIPRDTYRTGHLISLDLFWCARNVPMVDYDVHLELHDKDGNVIGESDSPLGHTKYPSSRWAPGELLMSQAEIVVPGQAKEESHELRLSLTSTETDEAIPIHWPFGPKSISLGNFMIEAWPLLTDLPEIPSQVKAEFGQPSIVEMHGYALLSDREVVSQDVSPGQMLDLTLFWLSISEAIVENYSVFVHLADKDEAIVAQSDGIPVQGFRPTTSWRNGEVIVDEHIITLPTDLATGDYDMWVGLYNPSNGERLPIFLNGQPVPDSRLLLNTLAVSP